MKTLHSMLVIALVIVWTGLASADETGFVSIFDGESFAGWEGNRDIFRIEDKSIVAGSLKKNIPHNEFLCTTKQYSDFELRLQAKLIGEGKNAGVQFRSQRIPNHFEVSGYQCDMGQQPTQNIWGALYDESRRRKFLSVGEQDKLKDLFKPNDWNALVIRCEGRHIQIWVNSYQTVDYIEKEDVAATGIIGLQIHGGKPAEAWYKNIRIKELTR